MGMSSFGQLRTLCLQNSVGASQEVNPAGQSTYNRMFTLQDIGEKFNPMFIYTCSLIK
jgi:hypothetical protein